MKLITVILALAASLFGCSEPKLTVDDGPGMVYHDSDYRTEYANAFEFDDYEGQPHFAVAFLGYGDKAEFRNNYVKDVFKDLSEESVDKIRHFDFEGDEWYLIVPRYKDDVEIRNLDTEEAITVHHGDAFTVKCNLSDLHPNIEVTTAHDYGGYRFSPQMGGDGRLITGTDVHDITDYSAIEGN
ncbi:MAG: hypothetical protein IKU43_10515 [Clostridia bacterium]|nr:hypothetical protein [Clostridia bacterium]